MGNNINNNSKIILNDRTFSNNKISNIEDKKCKRKNEDNENKEEQNKMFKKEDKRNKVNKKKTYIKEISNKKDKNNPEEISIINNKENISENHKLNRKNFDNISGLIKFNKSFDDNQNKIKHEYKFKEKCKDIIDIKENNSFGFFLENKKELTNESSNKNIKKESKSIYNMKYLENKKMNNFESLSDKEYRIKSNLSLKYIESNHDNHDNKKNTKKENGKNLINNDEKIHNINKNEFPYIKLTNFKEKKNNEINTEIIKDNIINNKKDKLNDIEIYNSNDKSLLNKEKIKIYNNNNYYNAHRISKNNLNESKEEKLILPIIKHQLNDNNFNNSKQKEKTYKFRNENDKFDLVNNKIKFLNNSYDNIRYEQKNYKNIINKLNNNIPKTVLKLNNLINKKQIFRKNALSYSIFRGNLKKRSLEYMCKHSVIAHKSRISCIISLKDKNEIATGSYDKLIKIWKISQYNSEILLISELSGHEDSILFLKYINDNNKLISASRDKTLRIWDIKYLNCIQTLRYHNSSVLSCSYNPLNNPYEIISAGDDKIIVIWEKYYNEINKKIEYKIRKTLKGHKNSVSSLLFIKENKYLISGSKDKTIKIWDYTQNYKCIKTINTLNSPILSLKYNYINYNINKNILIISCEDGYIYFIDINLIKIVKSIQFPRYTVNDFEVDNSQIYIAGNDHKIRIWNFKERTKEILNCYQNNITSLIKFDFENIIIAGSYEGYIRIWCQEYINKYNNNRK